MEEKEIIAGLEYEIKLLEEEDRFAAKDISVQLLRSTLDLIKEQQEIIKDLKLKIKNLKEDKTDNSN